jgi:hypothetical protein
MYLRQKVTHHLNILLRYPWNRPRSLEVAKRDGVWYLYHADFLVVATKCCYDETQRRKGMVESRFRNTFELFRREMDGEVVVREELAFYGIAKRESRGWWLRQGDEVVGEQYVGFGEGSRLQHGSGLRRWGVLASQRRCMMWDWKLGW